MSPDFRDMLSEFSAAGVEFLVIGAYAVAAHGLPRATGDIDLWVRCNAENAERIMEALNRFGAPLHDVSAADFHEPDICYQIGVTPNRIDVVTQIDGVRFEEAWPNRVVADVLGLQVPVVGLDDLLTNKRATGRRKDLNDVTGLVELAAKPRARRQRQ